MADGRIKWYDAKKGFGFIETDNDGDIFVHQSGVVDHGNFGLQKTDQVTFEIKKTPRGIQAVEVKNVTK